MINKNSPYFTLGVMFTITVILTILLYIFVLLTGQTFGQRASEKHEKGTEEWHEEVQLLSRPPVRSH